MAQILFAGYNSKFFFKYLPSAMREWVLERGLFYEISTWSKSALFVSLVYLIACKRRVKFWYQSPKSPQILSRRSQKGGQRADFSKRPSPVPHVINFENCEIKPRASWEVPRLKNNWLKFLNCCLYLLLLFKA